MSYYIFEENDPSLTTVERRRMFKMKYNNNITFWFEKDIEDNLLKWRKKVCTESNPCSFSNFVDWSLVKYRFPNYNDIYSKINLYFITRGSSFSLPFAILDDRNSNQVSEAVKRIPKNNKLWFLKLDAEYAGGGYDVEPIIADDDMEQSINEGIRKSKSYKLYRTGMKFVLQKGIDNPLLIDGRKFDLRVYYMITSVNNQISFFVFRQCLIRMSVKKYNRRSTDKSSQITNITYGSKLEKASKLVEVMDDQDPLYRKIYLLCRELSAIIKDRFVSRIPRFYIFGIDVIFDEREQAFLEEVNIRPHVYKTLEESEEYQQGIDPKLAEGVGQNVILKLSEGKLPTKSFGLYYRVL